MTARKHVLFQDPGTRWVGVALAEVTVDLATIAARPEGSWGFSYKDARIVACAFLASERRGLSAAAELARLVKQWAAWVDVFALVVEEPRYKRDETEVDANDLIRLNAVNGAVAGAFSGGISVPPCAVICARSAWEWTKGGDKQKRHERLLGPEGPLDGAERAIITAATPRNKKNAADMLDAVCLAKTPGWWLPVGWVPPDTILPPMGAP